jgi:hypothetical protein
MVYMQVDAALFPPERRMGWGAVLRDHNGGFILCYNDGIDEFPSLELAEGLAIRRVLVVLKEHGYLNTILVSNCLCIIQRNSSPVQTGQWWALW